MTKSIINDIKKPNFTFDEITIPRGKVWFQSVIMTKNVIRKNKNKNKATIEPNGGRRMAIIKRRT